MTADIDVENAANGNSGPGTSALPYALVARFYDGHLFGRSKDYTYPEASNVSSSRWDSITSLDKNLDRTALLADGNDYDVYDMLRTITKSVLLANPHINDDEPLSVNYKGAPAAPSATKQALDAYWAKAQG